MKNNSITLERPNALLASMASFFLFLFFLLFMQNAKAQNYRANSDSQINISVDSASNVNDSNRFSAQANFIVKDGVLDEVTSFNMAMPIAKLVDQSLTKDSISFELTHVMVLPIMKKIHAVGMLNVAGVIARTDIEFDFVVNADQSITLNGAKSIKLDDYRKETAMGKVSCLPKNDELKLSINLVLKNEPVKTERSFNAAQSFKNEQLAMLTSR